MTRTIELDISGRVGKVTLNRPEVRNAFNARMIDELTAVFVELATNADVQVVVLRGAGKSFSAGADITWMQSSLEFTEDENAADARRMSDMFRAVETLPQPVIAQVHGAALGGGMGLVAACDIAVADAACMFGFTEVKLGIIPAVISAVVVPKIGQSWARALYVTGERFDSQVAQRIGLVHWISDRPHLSQVVDQKVTEILSSGPLAVRAAKALPRWFVAHDHEAARQFTSKRISEVRTSEEGQEGLRAFLEKRSPSWKHGG